MITTDLRNAAGLAAAGDFVERSALAGATPRPLLGTTLPVPAGIAPARPLAIALRPARARKARSARRPAAGYAPAKGTAPKAASAVKTSRSPSKSSAKSSASDPLAFLKDPKLTIEDKLMMLLAHMNDRWDKEMDAKMKEIAASEEEKTQKSSKSSKSSGGGILGGLGGVADFVQKAATGGILGAVGSAFSSGSSLPDAVGSLVSELGGPALAAGAAALGFPELAPALVKLGPELGKLTKSWLSDATGAGGAGKGSSSSSSKSASSSGGKVLTDSQQQLIVMQIQRIQQQQKEMFALVSDVLKGNHDARMSVLNNMR